MEPDRKDAVVCVVCSQPILLGQGLTSIQQFTDAGKDYHSRCFERLEAGERPSKGEEQATAARALVEHFLAQYRCGAVLVDFVAAPPEHYTVRIDLPGDIGKTLILSRDLVEGALDKPPARRSLQLHLRSALVRQWVRRAVDQRDEAIASRPPLADSQVLAHTCAGCERPITLRDRLVVRQARLWHGPCAPGAK